MKMEAFNFIDLVRNLENSLELNEVSYLDFGYSMLLLNQMLGILGKPVELFFSDSLECADFLIKNYEMFGKKLLKDQVAEELSLGLESSNSEQNPSITGKTIILLKFCDFCLNFFNFLVNHREWETCKCLNQAYNLVYRKQSNWCKNLAFKVAAFEVYKKDQYLHKVFAHRIQDMQLGQLKLLVDLLVCLSFNLWKMLDNFQIKLS